MKLITSMIVMMVSSIAVADECPNFSGQYIWSGNSVGGSSVALTVQQTDCVKADAVYDYGYGITFDRPMIFDGVSRQIIQSGDLTSIESFTLKDGSIVVVQEDHWKNGSSGDRIVKSNGKIYIDASKNLIEDTDTLGDDGQTVVAHSTTLYTKQ
jgi:hypothetical protein